MKIRKVEVLVTIRTKEKKYPKGIYSVDSLGGIPKVLLQEAEKGSKLVRILQYDKKVTPEPANELAGPQGGAEGGEITTLDQDDKVVNTAESKVEKPKEPEKPKRTTRRRIRKSDE